MRTIRIVFASAMVLASVQVQALPNFARREGLDCAVCHTNIPRLSRFGFEYRNAGYRVPGNLGKDAPTLDFANFNSVTIKNEDSWTRQSGTDETGAQVSARPQFSLQFLEASLFPATGAWGRWFASSAEIALAPGDVDIEKAYVRFTYGTAESHLNVRAGIIHPFEGYGASDEPIGLSDPLFREAAPFDRSSGSVSVFAPTSFNEAAFEVGYTRGGFNISAAVLNGIVVKDNGPVAFIGGDNVRNSADPNLNSKDIHVFANQFIGDAALSASWYHGTVTIPGTVAAFTDQFDRVALYGTLPIVPRLWLLGGLQWGWDDGIGPDGAPLASKYQSVGWFGEAYSPLNDYIGVSLRYDRLDPSRGTKDDLLQAFTVGVNLADLNGGQAILEYRLRDAESGLNTSVTTNEVRLRLAYSF